MDIYACRYTLLYCSLISVGVSVISVLLLRFLASILVWIVIGGMTLCSLAGTALMWYAYAVSGKVFEISLPFWEYKMYTVYKDQGSNEGSPIPVENFRF